MSLVFCGRRCQSELTRHQLSSSPTSLHATGRAKDTTTVYEHLEQNSLSSSDHTAATTDRAAAGHEGSTAPAAQPVRKFSLVSDSQQPTPPIEHRDPHHHIVVDRQLTLPRLTTMVFPDATVHHALWLLARAVRCRCHRRSSQSAAHEGTQLLPRGAERSTAATASTRPVQSPSLTPSGEGSSMGGDSTNIPALLVSIGVCLTSLGASAAYIVFIAEVCWGHD